MAISIIAVNYFTHSGFMFWHWTTGDPDYSPCHDLEVIPVWSKNFPKFISEGNVRLLNISKDDVLDVVLGFGTGSSTAQ